MRLTRRGQAALLAGATVLSGAVIAVSMGALSSGSESAKPTRVQVVDHCGRVVLDEAGQPVVVELDERPPGPQRLDGPVLEDPPEPDELQPVVPLPADPRAVNNVLEPCPE